MKLLLILLPALAHARFNIRIDVATRESDVNVNLLGEDDHIIDDAETKEFRLTDYSLKSACSHVVVATLESDVNVNLLGEDDHIIDDAETREFRLTDYSLKSACSQ
ncbi:uncharacterized protein LOC125236942 [Leguminivora glycinivorella]|uniref:uncharacterized protein LOC125236942 n=1 Tax=Leguminivora glycinivorella TaxID=1035111 RepID=UPI00200FDD02|nr:uncharacterized protein LOC125236942 [Leguminivora glycinivorella]